MTPGQDESIADIYVGEYVNGKAHGTGKFTWAGQIFFVMSLIASRMAFPAFPMHVNILICARLLCFARHPQSMSNSFCKTGLTVYLSTF